MKTGFTLQTTGGSSGSNNEGTFTHHGNVTQDGKKVLVYGDKGDSERAPQTRRALNQETMEQMVRGKIGIGTPGVDALQPFEGRKAVNISNWAHPESPYREDFCNACTNVIAEAREEEVEIPEWLEEAVAVKVSK